MLWPIAPIVTDRLTIREAVATDAELFRRLLTDEEVRRHLGGPVVAEHLDQRTDEMPWKGVFTVDRSDGVSLGVVNIGRYRTGEIELSYQLLPEYWGNGYAREACAPVLAWASADVANGGPVIAVTQAANIRSVRLLESLGMKERERFMEFDELQVLMITRD